MLFRSVGSVREAVNPGLTLRGAFFTHWQNRETFAQARRSLEDSGICPVLQTAISYNPKVPESTLEEKPLCVFAPRSWAAIQYKKLTAEYLALTDSGKGKEGTAAHSRSVPHQNTFCFRHQWTLLERIPVTC